MDARWQGICLPVEPYDHIYSWTRCADTQPHSQLGRADLTDLPAARYRFDMGAQVIVLGATKTRHVTGFLAVGDQDGLYKQTGDLVTFASFCINKIDI